MSEPDNVEIPNCDGKTEWFNLTALMRLLPSSRPSK